MRTIKFRAWDERNGRMIYVDEPGLICFAVGFNGELYELKGDAGESGWSSIQEARPIIMQFTGLKDKNGKEIYEGDVIQWGYGECKECGQEHKKRTGKVYWSEFGACYQTSNGDYLISNRGNTQLKGNGERDDLEVVGNIYENPDL